MAEPTRAAQSPVTVVPTLTGSSPCDGVLTGWKKGGVDPEVEREVLKLSPVTQVVLGQPQEVQLLPSSVFLLPGAMLLAPLLDLTYMSFKVCAILSF